MCPLFTGHQVHTFLTTNISRVPQPFAVSSRVAFFHESIVLEFPVYTGHLFVTLRCFSHVLSSRRSRCNCGGRNTEYRHCTASTEVSTSSSLIESSLLSTFITATSELSSKTW